MKENKTKNIKLVTLFICSLFVLITVLAIDIAFISVQYANSFNISLIVNFTLVLMVILVFALFWLVRKFLKEYRANAKYLEDTLQTKDKTIQELDQSKIMLRATQSRIIDILVRATEYRDNDTSLHTARVCAYSCEIAMELKLPQETVDTLRIAASMHDIGKIGIPDDILNKPGSLDEAEWEIMRKHPKIGSDIIGYDVMDDYLEGTDVYAKANSVLLDMASIISLEHHERVDGKGYPRRLKSDKIHIVSKIVSLADVFDALTSVRPYKKAFSVDDALKIIQEDVGTRFDKVVVDAFVARFDKILEIKEQLTED